MRLEGFAAREPVELCPPWTAEGDSSSCHVHPVVRLLPEPWWACGGRWSWSGPPGGPAGGLSHTHEPGDSVGFGAHSGEQCRCQERHRVVETRAAHSTVLVSSHQVTSPTP